MSTFVSQPDAIHKYAPYETNSLPDSRPRLERMSRLIREQWGCINVDVMKVDVMKTILADHDGDPSGICRHGGAGMHSISGYIAEPAERRLHIRRGHGCLDTWQTYEASPLRHDNPRAKLDTSLNGKGEAHVSAIPARIVIVARLWISQRG